jgi:hypothetical protein
MCIVSIVHVHQILWRLIDQVSGVVEVSVVVLEVSVLVLDRDEAPTFRH